MSLQSVQKRVVVVGGGISGLAAAHRLAELDASLHVTLLDAGPRLGGVLETVKREGFLIERSADNFITQPDWAASLCRRIGLADQLLPTTSAHRGAMVVRRGRLVRVPAGLSLMAPSRLLPLLTTPLLSPWGKARMLAEYFVPARRGDEDESLASFARRRLGREAYERIVQPLVGGIYSADPEKLSLRATLPRFIEMEQRWGGLIRGATKSNGSEATPMGLSEASGARYGLFMAPREGLTRLVDALAARLPADTVRLNCPARAIARGDEGTWRVRIEDASGADSELACDAVIVALPAPAAAGVLSGLDGQLADALARIEYAGISLVSLGYRRGQIDHPLDTFGFVVPAIEGRRILAASFSSVKFPGRAPGDAVLIRVFIGGACQSALAEGSDDELSRIAREELASLLGTRGEPLLVDIARWPRSMPQYHLGHCQRIADIERASGRWPNLALAGNAYHGVGIPHCIRSGETAAELTVAGLRTD